MHARNPAAKTWSIRSILLLSMVSILAKGQNVESFGVFAGLNFPFTIDQGLHSDNRYFGQFTVRGSPIGFTWGYDRVGHGILITPSYLRIGQKYSIRNTAGGEVGTRDIQMDYFTVPVALKLHLNDLAFFRLSVVASINFDYLMVGRETISHSASKIRYPKGVAIPTDPGYTVVYDGVFVPDVTSQVYVDKDKFKPIQLSAGVGFHSDFDLNDDWSLTFDGRAVFGIFDPRKESYTTLLMNTNPGPDLYGQRREVYLAANVGICRIVQTKEKFRPKYAKKSAMKGKRK